MMTRAWVLRAVLLAVAIISVGTMVATYSSTGKSLDSGEQRGLADEDQNNAGEAGGVSNGINLGWNNMMSTDDEQQQQEHQHNSNHNAAAVPLEIRPPGDLQPSNSSTEQLIQEGNRELERLQQELEAVRQRNAQWQLEAASERQLVQRETAWQRSTADGTAELPAPADPTEAARRREEQKHKRKIARLRARSRNGTEDR